MTGIPGVELTSLEIIQDDRGAFAELARLARLPFAAAQVSHSRSRAGVLRGLHFHRRQSDLWYLAHGRAQVALVDLRDRGPSPVVSTFALDEAEPVTLLIPPGVAHGYLALTDIEMVYLTSHEFDPSDEHGVRWDDPAFAIDWLNPDPILSERDRSHRAFTWDDIPTF